MPSARLASLVTALAALLAGSWIAASHPLAPLAAGAVFLAWALASMLPTAPWLWLLPAALPVASLAPWTGWTMFDEFDLIVTATLAGSHARLAATPRPPRPDPDRSAAPDSPRAAAALLGLWLLLAWAAWWRHGSTAGAALVDPFASYTDPANGLRVLKAPLYALLLWAPVGAALREHADLGARRFAVGVSAGLGLCVAAVLWERIAYVEPFDFGTPYRTTALFWEMHVGGGALDAYLAATAPFVAWALGAARTPTRWAFAALAALAVEYACLTTFSRGVYLATAASLAVLLWLSRRAPCATAAPAWRRPATLLLGLLMAVQAAAVLLPGSFMMSRLAQGELDFGGRLAHWAGGLSLLRGPGDWLLGVGPGRLPARYAAEVAGHELSGAVRAAGAGSSRHVVVSGPAASPALGGLFALTQRVPLVEAARYRVGFDAWALREPVDLELSVCELHLLYERQCQRSTVRVNATGGWQQIEQDLAGPPLQPGRWWAPRRAVFALSVLTPGGELALDRVSLRTGDEAGWLHNGDFTEGLAHWLPSARRYFLPWHIDNLYLELLVEHGVLGLAAFLVAALAALRRLGPQRAHLPALAPVLLASLCGVLLIGGVISIMDAPRAAFLVGLLLVVALQTGGAVRRTAPPSPVVAESPRA